MSNLVHAVGTVSAWLLAAAWSLQALLVSRGLRRLPNLVEQGDAAPRAKEPLLAVIVPARDEAAGIEACLRSLLAQRYTALHIVAVDDRSSDGTGAILDRLAAKHPERLSVLHVSELPEGWLGKTHAMAMAAQSARRSHAAEWLLFTDGDVLFHPECLRRTLARAVAEDADHFVTLPTAIVKTPGESLMMGFLQVMGLWGVRLWKVADPRSRDTVGVGAFNLLRSSAYDRIGGFARLRLQVLEDLALARLVKDSGLRQRVALAPGYVRVHWAPGVTGILHTMTKNLFAVFQFRILLLLVGCAVVAALCLGPFACLLWQPTRLPAAVAILAIATLYRIAARYLTPIATGNALFFAPAAVLFVYALFRSALVTLAAGGVRWRGTLYPLAELRRQAVKLR